MTQFTKQAITLTFLNLLNEKPFDKITVTDIVDTCGINRNTFYYYYHDIYQLIDDIFSAGIQKLENESAGCITWQTAFMEAMDFARTNRRAIYHIYNSSCREKLEKYLYDVIKAGMDRYINRQSTGLCSDERDKNAVSTFYTYALTGIIVNWLKEDMQTEPGLLVERLGFLLEGNIRCLLEKSDAALSEGHRLLAISGA